MTRALCAITGLFGLSAVALGAYGAHGLMGDETTVRAFNTGVQYHMWHTLAALGALILADRRDGWSKHLAVIAAFGFLTGVVLFSGALYLSYGAQIDGFGFLAPIGGFVLMASWGTLAVAGLRRGT